MKIQIHRISIDADFTNVGELRNALEQVVKDYEAGFREYKKPFVKWVSHPKGEVDTEVKPVVGDLVDKGYKYEDRDGNRYILIESKINKKL